ncbi:nucleotide-binding protein [Shewanella marinintestina]|uniref:TIR domain-containing protein n=1 Tax=Shewanella marinintestina TaxID=190305 RepID=UPI00200C48F4|nr:nucleotide-binding protein [Shewanella marinintestina]MCL1148252.1 nucleotide-binding protein [Shewanella marinintestina]
MSGLPRIFIASSSESYEVASACNTCMDRKAEPTIWTQIFVPGGTTLQTLTEKAANVDFALFIFTPDDLTVMRGKEKPTVRDNVLFELGLFIGALGQERCFILKPRGEDLHFPTDLLGINTQDYNPNRSDSELDSAVNAACSQFIKQMGKLGHFHKKVKDFINNPKVHKTYSLNEVSLKLISILLSTATTNDSFAMHQLQHECKGIPEQKLHIAVLKLLRAGFIEKVIESDWNGNEWFAYNLTTDGVEYALENEELFDQINAPQPQYGQSQLKPKLTPAQQAVEDKAIWDDW